MGHFAQKFLQATDCTATDDQTQINPKYMKANTLTNRPQLIQNMLTHTHMQTETKPTREHNTENSYQLITRKCLSIFRYFPNSIATNPTT